TEAFAVFVDQFPETGVVGGFDPCLPGGDHWQPTHELSDIICCSIDTIRIPAPQRRQCAYIQGVAHAQSLAKKLRATLLDARTAALFEEVREHEPGNLVGGINAKSVDRGKNGSLKL